MGHSRWDDVRERMREAYEAEQARIAAMTPDERAEHERIRADRRRALDELIRLSEEDATE